MLKKKGVRSNTERQDRPYDMRDRKMVSVKAEVCCCVCLHIRESINPARDLHVIGTIGPVDLRQALLIFFSVCIHSKQSIQATITGEGGA